MIPVHYRGGPLAGQRACLPMHDGAALSGQLVLSQLHGIWHCYQLVPFPDSDVDYHLSYLGVVDQLPSLAVPGMCVLFEGARIEREPTPEPGD